MTKHRELFNLALKGYKESYDNINYDVMLKVYGIFDTSKVLWTYYLLSVISIGSDLYQTSDVSNGASGVQSLVSSMLTTGIKFETLDDAQKYAVSFKTKWESGKNQTLSDIRDQKIDEITNGI